MFLLSHPSRQVIEHFISAQTASDFSYSQMGAADTLNFPKGFDVDHNRIQLGVGRETWERASKAIKSWQMFNMPWIQLCWPQAPIKVGTNVAILIDHFGFVSLNASRIVCTIEQEGAVWRYGFAYGTLADHGESGEERFSVEWNKADDSVWYDLLAFSRPKALIARLGYPLSRMLQRRFVDGSQRAMLRAVNESS
jgi:uncharacterized protein (UPF0548 family)